MDQVNRRKSGAKDIVDADGAPVADSASQGIVLHKENWLSILDDIGLAALAIDKAGQISHANNAASSLIDLPVQSIIQSSVTDTLPELRHIDRLDQHLCRIAMSGTPQELLARTADGKDIPVTVTISFSIHDDDDRFLVVLRDQSRQETSIERTLRSDQLFTDIMNSFHLCSFDWDLETDDVSFQGSWRHAFGLIPPQDVSDIQWLLRHLHGEDHGTVLKELRDLRRNASFHMECEARLLPPIGQERWVLIRASNRVGDDGAAHRIVGGILDITRYKTAEQQAAEVIQEDSLTGLPNREYLLSHIHNNCRDGDFALIVIDIDRFRLVNESLGSWVGDDIIRILGERIRHRVRKNDIVARLSGDQFAILIHDAKDDAHVQEQIARIRRRIGETVNMGAGATVNLDINAGIRRWSGAAGISAEDVLRDAVIALRSAKEMPSPRIIKFYPELQKKMMDAASFEKDVRAAIRAGQVEAYYQPIIETHSGQPTGFEALARLHHPDRGVILPADFIPLAEETGLINDLAGEIIRQSTRQLAEWQRLHPDLPRLSMAVNLSPAQFDEDWIIEVVKNALGDTGLRGSDLKIEITENLLMDDIDGTTRILDQLRNLGIQVCIDDFGTGYSSLSYLRNYSFDTLKIDRSFISQITDEPRHAELVRTIVQLGQNVGMNIVVEGVEHLDQHSLLTELGCHYLQGYLVAEPLTAAAATDWLRRWLT